MSTAFDILEAARMAMIDRAAARDAPSGERSMTKTVRAFNVLFGDELRANGGRVTEVMGWRFMELLKIARGEGPDEFIDGAAYAALAGEAAARTDVRKAPDERG